MRKLHMLRKSVVARRKITIVLYVLATKYEHVQNTCRVSKIHQSRTDSEHAGLRSQSIRNSLRQKDVIQDG